jgi:DNA replication factor GINS
MNVEELRTVQRTERQKDSLQHLRDSFYRDVADYLAERKAERERLAAEADDPFSSSDVGRLTDEIEAAEEVVESIYERRIGKIVKRATFAAAGMATEDEGLTGEERELFEDLVARIEANRETVLDGLVAGTDADDADDGSDRAPTETPTTDDATSAPAPDDLLAAAMGGSDDDTDGTANAAADVTATDGAGVSPATNARDGSPTADVPSGSPASTAEPEDRSPGSGADDEDTAGAVDDGEPAGDPPRTTLRITRDVGEILGVDERAYDLTSEDVVTLPTPNAEPLLDRDAAERLD